MNNPFRFFNRISRRLIYFVEDLIPNRFFPPFIFALVITSIMTISVARHDNKSQIIIDNRQTRNPEEVDVIPEVTAGVLASFGAGYFFVKFLEYESHRKTRK